MPQEHESCKDCIYYFQFKDGRTNLGYCKADPPIILQGSGHKNGSFPIMPQDEWCGAFKPTSKEKETCEFTNGNGNYCEQPKNHNGPHKVTRIS